MKESDFAAERAGNVILGIADEVEGNPICRAIYKEGIHWRSGSGLGY
jgi:hypothetical protein